MSDAGDDGAGSEYRTVSDPGGFRPDSEMTMVGYGLGAIILVLLLPLLPVFALIWLADRLFGTRTDRPGGA